MQVFKFKVRFEFWNPRLDWILKFKPKIKFISIFISIYRVQILDSNFSIQISKLNLNKSFYTW